MEIRRVGSLALAAIWLALAWPGLGRAPQNPPARSFRYLTFQVFTSNADPRLPLQPKRRLDRQGASKAALADMVQSILDDIGETGIGNARLGFMIGPVSLDHSDDEMRRII